MNRPDGVAIAMGCATSSKTVRKDAAFIKNFSSEMEAHLSLHVSRRMSLIIIKPFKKSILVKEE
jgi:hypothetical protein